MNVFKILIGLSPICCVGICVGPMRHYDLILRHFHSCSCIFHWCCALLHAKCLTKCPSDILVLIWTQVSPFAWVSFWLNMLDMFWSMGVCFTHFNLFVPQCHAMHTLGTHYASPTALTCISSCTHMHNICRHMLSHLNSCIVFMFTCFNCYSMLFLVFFALFWVGYNLFYAVLLKFGTNLNLIKFCALFCVFVPVFVLCSPCKCANVSY